MLASCKTRVVGQSAKSARCSRDDECTLRPAGCCPPCGRLRVDQVRAVSLEDSELCNKGCGQCATGMPANVAAECVEQRCVVVETKCDPDAATPCAVVSAPALLPRVLPPAQSACTYDRDCRLVVEQCCHCGVAGGNQVLSIDHRVPFQCKGGCPDCLSEGVDPSLAAVCVAGRCRVKDLGLDPDCSRPPS
jgi:hypothetical protein